MPRYVLDICANCKEPAKEWISNRLTDALKYIDGRSMDSYFHFFLDTILKKCEYIYDYRITNLEDKTKISMSIGWGDLQDSPEFTNVLRLLNAKSYKQEVISYSVCKGGKDYYFFRFILDVHMGK